ncbi:MAG: hypothetical protein QXW34_00395 [Candidatus Methanomethyliaceae archaeon]
MIKKEEKILPSYKLIFLLFIVQITLISIGGFFGFSSFSARFLENLHEYTRKYELGREGSLQYIYSTSEGGYIYANFGLDMKTKYNDTHMVVYWYMNVKLRPGATVLDLIENWSKAEWVELRIYPIENPSFWIVVEDYDVNKYSINVKLEEIGGLRYIVEINNFRNVPGALIYWMIYFWDRSIGGFQYLAAPPDKILVYNLDNFVFLYDKFGAWPPDCCSGSLRWEYEGYGGATK